MIKLKLFIFCRYLAIIKIGYKKVCYQIFIYFYVITIHREGVGERDNLSPMVPAIRRTASRKGGVDHTPPPPREGGVVPISRRYGYHKSGVIVGYPMPAGVVPRWGHTPLNPASVSPAPYLLRGTVVGLRVQDWGMASWYGVRWVSQPRIPKNPRPL